jgi:hypothetical protein
MRSPRGRTEVFSTGLTMEYVRIGTSKNESEMRIDVQRGKQRRQMAELAFRNLEITAGNGGATLTPLRFL